MDFEQIENSKENVQPLVAGRNVAQLARQLKLQESQLSSSTVSVFEEGCKEWEQKLEADEEDPLAVWDDYIKWAQQNATSDKLLGHIVPLLQRCTRAFRHEERYKNDPRYLRVWIKYIDTMKDPSDIFGYLEANGIGQNLALFYTSWALVLELKKNLYAEAYAKIEEGINRKAEPAEACQFALKQFQHRMNKRTMEAMKNAAMGAAPAPEASNPNAREFGDQLTKSRKVAKPVSSIAGGTRKPASQPAKAAPVKGAGNSAGFSIFIDSDVGGAAAAPTGAWDHMPTEKERTKENARAASKWTKEEAGTIPQKRVRSAAPGVAVPKAGVDFELFQDEEVAREADQSVERKPVRLQLDGGVGLRRDKEAFDREQCPLEFLSRPDEKQDFLLPPSDSQAPTEGGVNYGAKHAAKQPAKPAAVARPQKKATAAVRPPVSDYELPRMTKQKSEDGTGCAGYNRAMLVLPDGEHISIEEARVLRMYGMEGLDGTKYFDRMDDDEDEDIEMEVDSPQSKPASEELHFKRHDDFSPPKHLSMTSVFDTGKQISPLPNAHIPDQTQPSPTFSNFAPKSNIKASASTPSVQTLKQVEFKPTPLAAHTPHYHSHDETGNAPTFGGNDISMISKIANSTFFTNTSRHTLCPGDANFTLHEEPILQISNPVPFQQPNENEGNCALAQPNENEENCAPAQLNFASSGGGVDCDEPNFFEAAAERVSPTVNTKKAQHQMLDMMPSPTSTSGFFQSAGRQASPTINSKAAFNKMHDLMPSPTATVGFFAESRRHTSPTINTKQAKELVQNLLPSPTETAGFFRSAAEGSSPSVNTKKAAQSMQNLMPSPTETVGFFHAAAEGASPTVNTKKAVQSMQNLMPSPTETVGFFHAAASPTINTKKATQGVLDFMPSPTVTCNFAPEESRSNAGGFQIREDTSMHLFQEPVSIPQSSGFAIREDTNLRGFADAPATNTEPGGFFIREDTNLKGFTDDAPASSSAFEIREDTSMKGFDAAPAPATASAGGFFIREDTNLRGFDTAPAETPESPVAGGGFFIREDTNLRGFEVLSAAADAEGSFDASACGSACSDKNALVGDENAPVGDENAPPQKRKGLRAVDEAQQNEHQAPQTHTDEHAATKEHTEELQDHDEASVGSSDAVAGNNEPMQTEQCVEVLEEDGVPQLCEDLNTIAEVSHDDSSFGFGMSVEKRKSRAHLDSGSGSEGRSIARSVLTEEDEDVLHADTSNNAVLEYSEDTVASPLEEDGNIIEELRDATEEANVVEELTDAAEEVNDVEVLKDAVDDANVAEEFKDAADGEHNAGSKNSEDVGADEVAVEEHVAALPSRQLHAEGGDDHEMVDCEAMADESAQAGPFIGWNRPFSELVKEAERSLHTNASSSVPPCLVLSSLAAECPPMMLLSNRTAQPSPDKASESGKDSAAGSPVADANDKEADGSDCEFGMADFSAPASPVVSDGEDGEESDFEGAGGAVCVDLERREAAVVVEVDENDSGVSSNGVEGGAACESTVPAVEASAADVCEEAVSISEDNAAPAGSVCKEAGTEPAEEGVDNAAPTVLKPVSELACSDAETLPNADQKDSMAAEETPAIEHDAEFACEDTAERRADVTLPGTDVSASDASIQEGEVTHDLDRSCLDRSTESVVSNGDALNKSTESSTSRSSRRCKHTVSYKEPALNVKCRNGANPWHMAANTSVDASDKENCDKNTSRVLSSEDSSTAPSTGLNEGGDGVTVMPYSDAEEKRRAGEISAELKNDQGLHLHRKESAPSVRVGSRLELGGQLLHVEAVLGKGAWSTVYTLRKIRTDMGFMENLDVDSLVAMKVLTSPSSWEFYVARQLSKRLEAEARTSLMEIREAFQYNDCAMLLCEHSDQPSLQKVINMYRQANRKMDESLVMFYAIELLRAVEACHAAGVLHGDVKPDNVLLRDDAPSAESEWVYDASRGFSEKGVKLVDFGCAIDVNMYQAGTLLSGRSGTDSFECVEMQKDASWKQEVDLYAVAATVHCLLHSEYMSVEQTDAGKHKPKLPFKRYWQVDLWTSFFDILINSGGRAEAASEARAVLEGYFQKNAAKAASIKMSLIKQDILIDQYASKK